MKLMTVSEVAEALSVSKSLVYELVGQGEIPFVAIGKSKAYRFIQTDIEAFIKERRVKNEGRKRLAPLPRLKHIKL